jgi:hypothetical protein
MQNDVAPDGANEVSDANEVVPAAQTMFGSRRNMSAAPTD